MTTGASPVNTDSQLYHISPPTLQLHSYLGFLSPVSDVHSKERIQQLTLAGRNLLGFLLVVFYQFRPPSATPVTSVYNVCIWVRQLPHLVWCTVPASVWCTTPTSVWCTTQGVSPPAHLHLEVQLLLKATRRCVTPPAF